MMQQQQQQRWRSRMNAHPSTSQNQLPVPAAGNQRDDNSTPLPIGNNNGNASNNNSNDSHNPHSTRTSVSAVTTNSNTNYNSTGPGAHRQIIGNYELGRVLATGDFDCRTRLCTHVTTGVPYVVRIYDKHVLAEAQWMWDRVAESIHVLRKLPRNKHILEMVECFESNTSVYILMHLFPSMNLTKLFTDEAAQAELLHRLHILSRASIRASAAAREAHHANGTSNSDDPTAPHVTDTEKRDGGQTNSNNNHNNTSFTSITMFERSSFRQLRDGRSNSGNDGNGGGSAGGSAVLDSSTTEREHLFRAQPTSPSGTGEEKRGSASIFPDALGSASVATAAAIYALEGPIPNFIPLALIRVLFEQVVKGVAFLHQNGIAHTGIAPDHLLVSPEGLLRIGNMVSACFCAPGERLHELRGTMHTVAPEVLRGEAYDPFKTDAWALGVVLYFMLNRGRYPHDGANTLRHILHGHTRPSRPGLPPVALDLLSRMMQPKPEDRLPVDAVLAHPFFTAVLPTAEEEMMADAAVAAAEAARNSRRSLYTGNPSSTSFQQLSDRNNNRNNNDHNNMYSSSSGNVHKFTSFNPRASNNSSVNSSSNTNNNATARGGGGGGGGGSGSGTTRRWGRGAASGNSDSNNRNVSDAEALAESWSTPHQQPRATIFSANSESSSVVLGAALSATFDALDGTTAPSGSGSNYTGGHTAHNTLDEGDTFIPQRQSSFADSGRALMQVQQQRQQQSLHDAPRPLWRPELAPSMDALEDLAARVIQHHFRSVLYRRRYKAETRALLKRGQSMYLSASNSSRDGVAAGSSTERRRSLLQSRRASSLSVPAPYVADTPAGTPPKSSTHPFHRRVSTSRTPASNTSTSPVSTSPAAWRRKSSLMQSHSSTFPGAGSNNHTAAAAGTQAGASANARWPASVNFNGSGGAGNGFLPNPARNRFNSSSVTIDTRGNGGAQYGSSAAHRLSIEGEDDDNVGGEGASEGARDGPGGRQARHAARGGSLTLPSLAATACGLDWSNDAPTPHHSPQQQQQLRLQNLQSGYGSPSGGGSGGRMPSGALGNASLLSQQGRRRSTMSAVLSNVGPTRASFERQRSNGSAVMDGEVCPLCHREPYAIRSIAIRPYAATPYQFTGGEFTKLLE